MTAPDDSIAAVLAKAIDDARELVRSEMALARAELREEAQRLRAGAMALAGAAVAALAALVFLLTTAAWGIAEGLRVPVWIGFGAVAVVLVLAAIALASVARRRLAGRRHMPLTLDTLRENMQWMRARTP